jgi:REP element-mobilizing transposase RayT
MDGATYFITFRTADSLARNHLAQLHEERRALQRKVDPSSAVARQELAKAMLVRIDSILDRGHGCQPLSDHRLAKITADAIGFYDGERYDLLSWCVMPNHVHVLTRLFKGFGLASVLHSWKSFSSKAVNELRGSSGRFWAREYYDHIARDEDEVIRIDRYIRENPVKAGLVDWPWVYSKL